MIGPILYRLTLSIQKTHTGISDTLRTLEFAVIEVKPCDKKCDGSVSETCLRKR